MIFKCLLLAFTISFCSIFGSEAKIKSPHLNLSEYPSFFKSEEPILPGYWCLRLKSLPMDQGVLTLSHSIALWEQTLMGQNGTIPEDQRKIDSFSPDEKQSEMQSDSFGLNYRQVEHAIKPMYFMPGEKMILELSNHDKTWCDKIVFYPRPLQISQKEKSLIAELLDFSPLIYRINFKGFESQDPCLMTTQAVGNKSVTSEFVPCQNNHQFQLAFLSKNKIGDREIQFTVQTKEGETLKLNLPTSTQLVTFCQQLHEEYQKEPKH